MGHQRAYRAAVDGKHRGNNASRAVGALLIIRRLLIAAAVFFVASLSGAASYAQSGPFAGMAGNWAGGGSVTLDDGSKERIRCRASYAVAGPSMNMTLTCASDAYKFNLQASVVDQGGVVSGTWSESSRNVGGSLEGRGGGGNFEVIASAAGFNANIALRTVGTKQSVVMRADSQFRGAAISMSRF
jgi:hypothetical protein